jgi:hypothetical protein
MGLVGQSDEYPLDWYSSAAFVGVRLPRSVVYVPPRRDPARDQEISFILPIQVDLRAAQALSDIDLRSNARRVTEAQDELRIAIGRRLSTKTFVFSLLAIPVLLALLIVAALRERGFGDDNGLRDLILGITGATLAILPIRQVLVPASIPGVTLVDWWLGGAVLLLAAVVLWWTPTALVRRGNGNRSSSKTPP